MIGYAIEDISPRRQQYPDANSQTFLTLEEYLEIARRCILSHVAHKQLCHQMLQSDDALSYVAHDIMMADWKFDSQGGKRTRMGYRSQCAKWSIIRFINNMNNSKNKVLPSINQSFGDSDRQFTDFIEDYREPGTQVIDEAEEIDNIRALLYNGCLTESEAKCLDLYYLHDLTLQEIGTKLGVSKQRIQQVVKKGLQTLKENLTNG